VVGGRFFDGSVFVVDVCECMVGVEEI